MIFRNRWLQLLLLSATLISACEVRAGYRVYDPYRGDYHRWNDHETVYYNRWVQENHRPSRDFKELKPDEQKEYWTWRHNHH